VACENALPRFDVGAFNQIIQNARPEGMVCGPAPRPPPASFTFLRLGQELLEEGNWASLCDRAPHACRTGTPPPSFVPVGLDPSLLCTSACTPSPSLMHVGLVPPPFRNARRPGTPLHQPGPRPFLLAPKPPLVALEAPPSHPLGLEQPPSSPRHDNRTRLSTGFPLLALQEWHPEPEQNSPPRKVLRRSKPWQALQGSSAGQGRRGGTRWPRCPRMRPPSPLPPAVHPWGSSWTPLGGLSCSVEGKEEAEKEEGGRSDGEERQRVGEEGEEGEGEREGGATAERASEGEEGEGGDDDERGGGEGGGGAAQGCEIGEGSAQGTEWGQSEGEEPVLEEGGAWYTRGNIVAQPA